MKLKPRNEGVFPCEYKFDEAAVLRGMQRSIEDIQGATLLRVAVVGKVGDYKLPRVPKKGQRRIRCFLVWEHTDSGQLLLDPVHGGWRDFDFKLLKDFELMGKEESNGNNLSAA